MRVLVCGGRDYYDADAIFRALDDLERTPTGVALVITGGASGADKIAERWASMMGTPRSIFRANWKAHGKAAGPIRNQEMLSQGKPDIVVAFPGGRGTADMVRRAREAGVNVVEPEAVG